MKPVTSRKELDQKATLQVVAELALKGSLFFNDMPSWAKNPENRNWILLKDVNFKDLYLKMKELDMGPSTSEGAAVHVEPETTQKEKVMSETETTPITKPSTSKQSPEKVQEVAEQVLTTALDEIGKSLPKKEIVTLLSLEEDLVSEALNLLRSQNKVKSGKGRKAKWERIS